MRLIGFVVVLAALVFVVGLAAGWWTVTTGSNDATSEVKLTVDKGKIEEHTEDLQRTAEKGVEKIEKAVDDLGTKEMEGRITAVDPPAGRLVVRTDEGRSVEVTTGPKTEITVEERPATLRELDAGKPVVVRFDEEDGLVLAHRIAVPRR